VNPDIGIVLRAEDRGTVPPDEDSGV